MSATESHLFVNGFELRKSSKGFLCHISGLRAVCILLVVLFHLDKGVCPDGFLGVDAFLVISGYFLLGKMYMQRAESFNISEYAISKIKRLYPVLMAVSCLTLIVTCFFVPTDVFVRTAKTARWALFGVANEFLNGFTNGYFATNDLPNPLLHTWYLGVMVQSLAFFGILCWCYHRFSWLRRHGRGICVFLFVAAVTVGNLPLFQGLYRYVSMGAELSWSVGYYSTCGRLWEFMAGGMVALFPKCGNRAVKEMLSCLSLALIVVFAFSSVETDFKTLVVVVATTLIIWCGEGTYCGRVLSSAVPVYVGKISYSVYLWHMPVIVLYGLFACKDLAWVDYGCIFLVTVFLSSLSYYFIESPKYSLKVIVVLLVFLEVAIRCCMVERARGVYGLGPKEYFIDEMSCKFDLDYYEDYPQSFKFWSVYPYLQEQAKYGGLSHYAIHLGEAGKSANFVVMGDCHAHYISEGLSKVCKDSGYSGILLPTYFTPFWNRTHIYDTASQNCDETKVRDMVAWLAAHPELRTVVLICRWVGWFGTGNFHCDWAANRLDQVKDYEGDAFCMKEFVSKVHEMGRCVVLFHDIPTVENEMPLTYMRQARIMGLEEHHSRTMRCTRAEYMAQTGRYHALFSAWEKEGLCQVFHADEVLFNEDGFYCAYMNGKVMTRDGNHLTHQGSLLWAELFKNMLPQIFSQAEVAEPEAEGCGNTGEEG